MAVRYANNASTILDLIASNSDTTINVVNAGVFPFLGAGDHCYVTLDDTTNHEIIKVTGISGNTLTCQRGMEGTTARQFAAGSTAEIRVTAAMLSDAIADNQNEIVIDNYVSGAGFTPSVTEELTLTKEPVSSGALIVTFDGIRQHTSEWSITGTTLTFTDPIPVGVKEVECISFVSSNLSSSPNGQVWHRLSSFVANNSSEATLLGIDDSYSTYAVILEDVVPATNSQRLRMYMGTGTGVDKGAGHYKYTQQILRSGSTPEIAAESSSTHIEVGIDVGNTSVTGGGINLSMYLRSARGDVFPSLDGAGSFIDDAGEVGQVSFSGARVSNITTDRIEIEFSSGAIASGRFTLMGLATT